MINKKKNTYFFFLILIIIYGIYCALAIGKTWDTFLFINIGKERLAYLFSFGTNEISEQLIEQLYPAIYNTLSAFILQLFPKKFELEVFHLINFSVSFLTVLGIYKLSKKLFNKEIATFTFIIFLLYPIFFGHMSINDRDTVMAFCNVWISFYALQYLKFDTKKNKKYVFYLGFLLALGLGVRFAFVATLVPIVFYSLYLIYISKKDIKIITIVSDIIKIILISSFIVFLFWSSTHEDILNKPYQLIQWSFDRGWGWPFVFINGEVFNSNQIPKSYIFQNLLFKTPEYILFLYLIFFILIFKITKYCNLFIFKFNSKIIFIFANILFPSALLFISPYSIYDGLRLFIYILPYFSIIPAIVIYYLYKNLRNVLNKILLIFLVIFKIYYLYIFFILTPYHYTYLNLFTGDFSQAHTKFENDYWGTSLKELSIKIENNRVLSSKSYVKFSICGVGKGSVKYYLNKIKNFNYKIVGENKNPDFIIIANRVLMDYDKKNSNQFITCFDKYNNTSLVEVKRNGLVLSAVKNID